MNRSRARTALLLALAVAACKGTPYREVEVDLGSPRSSGEAGRTHERTHDTFRFSVAAMESPRDTYSGYARLFSRLGARLERPVEFVQRRTYREVNDLIIAGRLDAALLCTGGYLDLQRRAPGLVEVVGVPVAQGRSTYRSLIIVPTDSPAQRIEDLEGKRFAFTDELSFSGRLYMVSEILERRRDENAFFSGTLYTYSHDRSIRAVADRVVDGAAVHSIVYERMVAREPALGARTRVIHRSPEFGMMPVVVSTRLSPELRARVKDALLGLSDDREGAEALRSILLDGFMTPPAGIFRSAEVVARRIP